MFLPPHPAPQSGAHISAFFLSCLAYTQMRTTRLRYKPFFWVLISSIESGSTGGPDNGGQFRFATVSWIKLQHYPPTIRFTVEAAFRRGFTAINYRGTGPDGKLIVSGARTLLSLPSPTN
jgi:hypothetical protein